MHILFMQILWHNQWKILSSWIITSCWWHRKCLWIVLMPFVWGKMYILNSVGVSQKKNPKSLFQFYNRNLFIVLMILYLAFHSSFGLYSDWGYWRFWFKGFVFLWKRMQKGISHAWNKCLKFCFHLNTCMNCLEVMRSLPTSWWLVRCHDFAWVVW